MVVVTAAAAGSTGGNLVIKYNKSFYTQRIMELENCYKQLQIRLSNLQGYQQSLPSAWNDVQAQMYVKKLSIQIVAVKNAMNVINDQKKLYNDIIADMDRSTLVVDETIGKVGSMIDSLGIKEG